MDTKLYKGHDNTALRFFERALKNNFESEKAGRPVYDTALMVEVIVPGSTESTPEFILERTSSETGETKQTSHYPKYKQAVEAYKANSDTGQLKGTPLSEWPQVNTGQVQTYKNMGIHTVEQLADVSDGTLGNMGIGARQLREQAKQWLSSRQFGVPSAQITAEVERLRSEVNRLSAENAQLRSMLPSDTGTQTPQEQPDQQGDQQGVQQEQPQGDPFAGLGDDTEQAASTENAGNGLV